MDPELLDLCQGLDIAVLVYDREFAPQVAAIRAELPDQLVLVEVAAGERVFQDRWHGHLPLLDGKPFRDRPRELPKPGGASRGRDAQGASSIDLGTA